MLSSAIPLFPGLAGHLPDIWTRIGGLELNTSGAVINGLDLQGNHAPGLKAYMIDGSSKFQNVTSRSDGSRSISSNSRIPLEFISGVQIGL